MKKWTMVRKAVALSLLLALVAMVMPGQASSTKAIAIDAGERFSVALMDDGTVWAWGYNDGGQLCDRTNVSSATPVKIPITGVRSISAGLNFVLALKDDGTVWAWGNNIDGSLGDGTNIDRVSPVKVKGLTGVKTIAAGGLQSMALKDDGSVWAWGYCYLPGTEGTRNTTSIPIRVPVTDVKSIACGYGFSAVIKNDGSLWMWGEGVEGALGNGKSVDSRVPVMSLIDDVTAISCGHGYTLAVKGDGTVWAWGRNLYYQLGNVTDDKNQNTPVKVASLEDVIAVEAGSHHSLALKQDGTVWAWGFNWHGTLGQGVDGHAPWPEALKVKGIENVKSIISGYGHSIALCENGTVWAWGLNQNGQLGDGTTSGMNDWTIGKSIPVQSLINIKPSQSPSASVTPGYHATATPNVVNYTLLTNDLKQPGITQIQSGYAGISMDYLAVGDDGLLYAFNGNSISCLRPDGGLIWAIDIPDKWSVCNEWVRQVNQETYSTQMAAPVFDVEDGYVYLYTPPSQEYPDFINLYGYIGNISAKGLEWNVICISSSGEIEWTLPLDSHTCLLDDTMIKASNGRVYVFNSYNETVIDRNGTVLFTIDNISDPAAVDEEGYLYASPGISQHTRINEGSHLGLESDIDYRCPSSVIEAYYPNGTLYWRKDLGERISRQYISERIRPAYGTMPLYQNHTLYIPLGKGIQALARDGSMMWEQRFQEGQYALLDFAPLDSNGNVYLNYHNLTDQELTNIYMISTDGKDVAGPRTFENLESTQFTQICAADGILYYVEKVDAGVNRSSLNDLEIAIVRAYDLKNDKLLWSYGLPIDVTREITINQSNIEGLFYFFGRNNGGHFSNETAGDYISQNIRGFSDVSLFPGDDVIYAVYKNRNCEDPMVLNRSKCVYAGGVYVFDVSGKILQTQPFDSPIVSTASNNGTLFIFTGDGKLSSMAVGLGAGVALITGASLIALFSLAAVVKRAKGKNDPNVNRAGIYRFICDRPGSTMYDIARARGQNPGTVRYHLLVLSLSHKVVTFKGEDKFVRYFMNSNAFSKDERAIISLMRRDNIRKLVTLLMKRPGLTNVEISKELDMPDSNVSRYLKELIDLGIVTKEPGSGDRQAYFLKEEYASRVNKIMIKTGL